MFVLASEKRIDVEMSFCMCQIKESMPVTRMV